MRSRRGVPALIMLGALGVVALPAPAAEEPHEPLTLRDGVFVRARTGSGEPEPVRNVTTYCLTCHGESAPESARPLGSLQHSHPVDTAYPGATPGYVSPGDLDERFVLTGRKLTCLTCHAHDRRDHALVVPLESGQFCTACHLK